MSDLDTLLREYGDAALPIDRSEVVRGQRRRSRPSVYAGAALAAAAALVSVVALTRGAPDRPTRVVTNSPASCGDAVGCPISAAQFLYVESETRGETTNVWTDPNGKTRSFETLAPAHRQIWIAPDGSGRLVQTFGQPTFQSAHDRAEWVAAGRDPKKLQMLPPEDRRFGPRGLGWFDVSQLPTTDPEALRVALNELDGGTPSPNDDFVHVGDALRETNTTRELRVALYKFALTIPGVKPLTDATDHSGRRGLGVAWGGTDGIRNDLIFDSKSYALLGEQATSIGPNTGDYPVGAQLEWTVYLRSGIVDSDTAVP